METFQIVGCLILLIGSVVLFFENMKLRSEIKHLNDWNDQLQSKTPEIAMDARQLLHDLTQGEAVVRVIPINPHEIFLRSPR